MTITNETELRQLFRSIPTGSLTVIVGGSGSGKTASCAVAIDEFKSQGLTVAYVETEEFDITRFLPEGVKPDLAYTASDLQGLETIREDVLRKFDVVVVEGLESLYDPHACFDHAFAGSFALFVQDAHFMAKRTGMRVLLTIPRRRPMNVVKPEPTERFKVLATPAPLYVQEAQVVSVQGVIFGHSCDSTRIFLGGQPADQSLQG